jgi:Di-haem oxidoreductase, putative peroxidase
LLDAVASRSGGPPAIEAGEEARSDHRVTMVTGVVVDERGAPLEGVSVRVDGAATALAVTGADGAYGLTASNGGARAGAWTVSATLTDCTFSPPAVKLGMLEERTVINFAGAGPRCAGRAEPVDPGPRPGPPSAGGPILPDRSRASEEASAVACLPGLAPAMKLLCEQAFLRFQERDSVSGTMPGEEGPGLGPAFNGNSCAMCHAQPSILGSSPGLFSPQNPIPNPQIALALLDGARNVVPSFVVVDGPVRSVRFKSDNSVHPIYTIAGRRDSHGCEQPQPDFAKHLAEDDVSLRVPLALFGLGLLEGVPAAALEANVDSSRSGALGIAGKLNRGTSDGSVGRFGWKAQDKSLFDFVGAAYNIEQGVTNEVAPAEREPAHGCAFNGTPEDHTDPNRVGTVSQSSSDVVNFAVAIRLSAPPVPQLPPGVTAESVERGRGYFVGVGCGHCHTPTLKTATSNLDPVLSKVVIHPYSDLALHHMGPLLADGIVQGAAGPDQFRTPPLWGIGQRLFFLHDGRTRDIVVAIEAHTGPDSEANVVLANFMNLTVVERQDLVNFVRSL